jgi:hypothetical protein
MFGNGGFPGNKKAECSRFPGEEGAALDFGDFSCFSRILRCRAEEKY